MSLNATSYSFVFRRVVSFAGHLLVLLLVVGACLLLLALGTGLWRLGYLDFAIPKPREIAPIAVHLYGPPITIRGVPADFHVEVRGKTGLPKWKLIKPDGSEGNLRVAPSQMRAEFSSLDEGFYTIYVAIGGEGEQSDSMHLQFENLNLVDQAEQVMPVSVAPLPPVPSSVAMSQLPPRETPAQLTMAALQLVESDDLVAEARMIASAIRTVMGQLTSSMTAFDQDPAVMVAERVNDMMKERTRKWDRFLLAVGAILQEERVQGKITSASTAEPTLNEIANVLFHVKEPVDR